MQSSVSGSGVETSDEQSPVNETSQSGLRQRTSSPDTNRDVSSPREATNVPSFQNFQSPPNNIPVNIVDRHRSLIITLIVMAIGLLVLRRLILI